MTAAIHGELLNQAIVEYIARESVRRYGEIEPRLPDLLRRNIRRRFQVSVTRDYVLGVVQHYKRMYAFAAAVLGSFRDAPRGKYLGKGDLLMNDLLAALAAHYPDEPRSLLQLVADYAVHYEYER